MKISFDTITTQVGESNILVCMISTFRYRDNVVKTRAQRMRKFERLRNTFMANLTYPFIAGSDNSYVDIFNNRSSSQERLTPLSFLALSFWMIFCPLLIVCKIPFVIFYAPKFCSSRYFFWISLSPILCRFSRTFSALVGEPIFITRSFIKKIEMTTTIGKTTYAAFHRNPLLGICGLPGSLYNRI